ncbi:cupin domain-containing protein [Actinophytocola sp.]|uniref:cupin domain-containing protein n=1 Tax=Actinophytocola sp. TaxID=1872138 RepID=UPI0039C8BA42
MISRKPCPPTHPHQDENGSLSHLPAGSRAQAHVHAGHESAVAVISGQVDVWYGDRLREHVLMRKGDCLYIPANVPHIPVNRGTMPMVALMARTDPREQESVRLIDLPGHLGEIGAIPIAAAT